MNAEICLLPYPRKLVWGEGTFALGNAEDMEALARVRVSADGFANAEAYRLSVRVDGIEITAASATAAFYAKQTLKQLARQAVDDALPCVEIEDWPDFPNRGAMLDISRDKVPTMETLRQLVDLFSELKYNQLQLYTEHTFAYKNHFEVWCEAAPLTDETIRELEAYCAERFIQLVPNQNSFGHMERWLKHERLIHLAETPDAVRVHYAATRFEKSFSLCPLDPGSLALLDELYAELLPNFKSGLFNVGCDETFELGQGRSKAECDARGKGRVYFEFLMKVHELVQKNGRTMMFWGDIIMQHPELIAELPRDVIALEWGYEADHPFEADTQKFAAAGIPFYVCPGTSSWNSLAGRATNALANLESAARHGLANGAIGYLVTDWGDNGHWQYLPFSYLGFAAGAAFSWCLASNQTQNWERVLDVHFIRETATTFGWALFQLGNIYLDLPSVPHVNGTILARGLLEAHEPLTEERATQLRLDEIEVALAKIAEIYEKVFVPDCETLEGDTVQSEVLMAAELMRHSLALLHQRIKLGAGSTVEQIHVRGRNDLAVDLSQLIKRHRSIWSLRNEYAGLRESAGRLERVLALYNAGL